MADILIGIVLILAVGLAAGYIIRAKKRGVHCIGCPDSSGCSGSCHGCSGCSHK